MANSAPKGWQESILETIRECRNILDTKILPSKLRIEHELGTLSNGTFIHASTLPTEPPTNQAISGLVPEGTRMIIGGGPETGKTFAMCHMALTMAGGGDYMGHYKIQRPRSILILDEESGPSRLGHRLNLLAVGSGINLADLPIYVSSMNHLRLDKQKDFDRIVKSAEAHSAEVLFIDSLVRIHGGDEQAAKDMSRFFEKIERLRETVASVCILSHIRKPPPGALRDDSIFAIRGSGDIGAWVDCGYLAEYYRGNFRMECVKFRDGQRPEPFEFAIEDVESGGVRMVYKGTAKKVLGALEQHIQQILNVMQDGQERKTADIQARAEIPKNSLTRALSLMVENEQILRVRRGIYRVPVDNLEPRLNQEDARYDDF